MAVRLNPSSCKEGGEIEGGGVVGLVGAGDDALDEPLGVEIKSLSSRSRKRPADGRGFVISLSGRR